MNYNEIVAKKMEKERVTPEKTAKTEKFRQPLICLKSNIRVRDALQAQWQ